MIQRLKRLAGVLAFAAIYFCIGKLGLLLAFLNASVSPIWPPTGIALAAMLLWGYRLWPGIFVGAFLVNITTPGNPVVDLGIAAGNTLEALVGAWLVNRYVHGVRVFDRAYDIFKYVLLAAMGSTAVSATVGVASLCLGREALWEQYPAIWLTWWRGDMFGALIVAPLLLSWLTQRFSRPELNHRLVEGASLVFTLVLLGQVIFLEAISLPSDQLKYLAILPLLWAAFRFGQRGASASVAAISGFALWGTLHGVGPFVTADANRSLLLLHVFVGTITVTALVVAAAVSERDRFQRRLRTKDEVSRILAKSSTLKEAAPKVIQALCEGHGWDLGAVWSVDHAANKLCCVEFWRSRFMQVSEFEVFSRQRTFAPGIGLPGRAWSSGKPAWILDVTRDSNFPRAPLAQKDGLRAAFCFPIKLSDAVLGVVECFSRQVLREPDEDFLQILDNIGHQLGQFIVGKQTDESRQDLLLRVRAARAKTELANREVEKQLAQRRQVEDVLGRWASAPLTPETRQLWAYGVAVAATGGALFLRLLFEPILGSEVPLVTAYGAVAFASWYGGGRAALFASVASYLGADWLFIEPRYTFNFRPRSAAGLSLYLISCFVIIAVGNAMRRAQHRAHASAQLAIARQQEVEAEMRERRRAERAVRKSEQQARRELKEMGLLQDLGQQLVKSADMQLLLEHVLDAAIAFTHTKRGTVQLFDTKSGTLNVIAQRGFQKPFPNLFAEPHDRQAASGRAMRPEETIVVEDVLSSKVFAGSSVQQILLDAGVQAVQSTLLLSRSGQRLGMISMYFGLRRQPEMREIQLLNLLARQAADFIERCNVEQALRQNEERLRIILSSALDAVITIDEQGNIVFWNSQAEKSFGWTQAEAVGKKLTDTIIPIHFREAHDGGLRHYFETGFGPALNRRLEMTALHRDGREFPVELAIAPVVVENQVYFSAFVRDITERKQAEERLLRFNTELKSRIEEHTAELTKTAAQLRATLHEREVLLQEIHHRVKNNLQVIASLLSLQSRYIGDPQVAAHFQESQGRIRSMALIHEKLYRSEFLSGVDLADYVKSLVGILVRSYASNPNVNLNVRLDPATVSIDTAVPVGLLLNELLTNALKYAFPNGRKGRLLVALEAKPAGQYAVRVEDDGVGLGADFEFEQADTLGLQLVRMLAKQLGAELTFRSESGHTMFEVRFQEPAAKSA